MINHLRYSLLIFLVSHMGLAQNASFHLTTISSGGGPSASPSYKFQPTISQPLTGAGQSSGYLEGFGFWECQAAIREFLWSTVSQGWNMVSIPRVLPDYSKNSVYPTSTANAFSYDHRYISRDTLRNGEGYWVKFAGWESLTYPGDPITDDSIQVGKGWNLIGCIGSEVPVSSVVQSPPGIVLSDYFRYDGGYFTTTSLEPGRAYWVKCSSSGSLRFSSSGSIPSINSAIVEPSSVDIFNILKIQSGSDSKRAGGEQKLYFSSSVPEGFDPEKYDLPPQPPKGGFDVRFTSNSSFGLVSGVQDEPSEVPIIIESNGGSVVVSWSLNSADGKNYSLIEKKGSEVISRFPLIEGGTQRINLSQDGELFLTTDEIPTRYALYQNYPNPFNPTTKIRYAVPKNGNVKLVVFDILGREVTTLVDEIKTVGEYSVSWNGMNVSSGVYFYRINAGEYVESRKMVLMK